MDKLIVIIPTYNPRQSLKEIINFFLRQKPLLIIIVNDGTKPKFLSNIPKLDLKNVVYLENSKNFGKGYSIKKALKFIINNIGQSNLRILHCDDDYQHNYRSILKIILFQKKINDNQFLIIGKRQKNNKTPKASKLGNLLINKILDFFFNIKDIDTQNGLRLYSSGILELILSCKSNRFEFETEMLLKILKNKINIHSVNIDTIYKSKHYSRFNKFNDTFLFARFLLFFLVKR